jgi:hypothetical protein
LQKSPQATEVMLWGVLYLGVLINIASTRYSLFAIHVDAPAIALMLWGVILYAKWWTMRSPRSMAMSAFFWLCCLGKATGSAAALRLFDGDVSHWRATLRPRFFSMVARHNGVLVIGAHTRHRGLAHIFL